jgi:hypothetical protein
VLVVVAEGEGSHCLEAFLRVSCLL